MTDNRLRNAAVAHGDAVLQLVDALRRARGVEWEVPPNTGPLRSLFHGDPTGELVANPERLRVRAATETGLLALTEATATLHIARTALDRALVPYVTEDILTATA